MSSSLHESVCEKFLYPLAKLKGILAVSQYLLHLYRSTNVFMIGAMFLIGLIILFTNQILFSSDLATPLSGLLKDCFTALIPPFSLLHKLTTLSTWTKKEKSFCNRGYTSTNTHMKGRFE
uniref:Uncharacterized protein n=1 Tax=Glossina brevipalpis TaxID=37001 RepID=A0A1A9W8W4_9MUSC